MARERHEAALRAAGELGAGLHVAHVSSIPLIRNPDYRETLVATAAEFWCRMADRAGRSETTVALENMWEPAPDLEERIVREADHPSMKASFGTGPPGPPAESGSQATGQPITTPEPGTCPLPAGIRGGANVPARPPDPRR